MFTKRGILNICITLSFIGLLLVSIAPATHAGGFIETGGTQSYLTAPAVGENVIGYMIGEYLGPDLTYIHMFVRRCECLRRLAYTSEGVFITYTHILSREEFDGFSPETLVGMVDGDGQLTAALAGQSGLIAVVEKVLEYKKVNTRFVARVSIKFVAQ